MSAHHLSFAVLTAVTLLAAVRSEATVTDNTSWSCTSHETLKVTGNPKSVDDFDGIQLDFDGEGSFSIYLPNADATYFGQTTAKGATGFLATPDAGSIDELRDYVADRVLDVTGADSVNITSFSWTIKGKVKNGILKAVLKAKGKGSLTLGGRTRKGSGKLTEVLVAQDM